MTSAVLEVVCLFFCGILAGEEIVVRYGVHGSLAVLDERSQVLARQGLIGRLKVLVPMIIVPATLSSIAVVVLSGTGDGYGFRWAGMVAVVAFLVFTFGGTVPINQRIADWRLDALPGDWQVVVRRWERIDVFRSSAAVLAFAFFLTAGVLSSL